MSNWDNNGFKWGASEKDSLSTICNEYMLLTMFIFWSMAFECFKTPFMVGLLEYKLY